MKNIKRYILTFVLFCAFFLFGQSNVFGYMIPYKVDIGSEGTTANISIVVTPYQSLIDDTNHFISTEGKELPAYNILDYNPNEGMQEIPSEYFKSPGTDEYNPYDLSKPMPIKWIEPGGKYPTYAAVYPIEDTYVGDYSKFSTDTTSEYLEKLEKDKNCTQLNYYEYDSEGNTDKITHTRYVTKIGKSKSEKKTEAYFYSTRLQRIKLEFTDSRKVKETYMLESNAIKAIKDKLYDGNNKIYMSFSLIRTTGHPNYYVNIDTLAKWFYLLNYLGGGCLYEPSFNGSSPDGSIANEYDNILVLPENFSNPVKVMVRHIDNKTGNVLTGNSNETLIDKDGNQSIIDTGWNTLEDKKVKDKNNKGLYKIDDIDFSEYYEIKKNANIRVDRLRNYMVDGKNYELTDCKVLRRKNKLKSSNIDKKMENSNTPKNTNNSYTYNSKKDIEYVYIDFYYDVDDETPPPTPEPGLDTKIQNLDGKNNPDSCVTATVPAGESLKPFLKTPSYQLRNLRYDLTVSKENDKIINYMIGNCSVLKLTSGKLTNSSNSAIGQVIGSSNATVFDGNPNNGLEIPLTNTAKKTISTEISNNFSAINDNITELPDQNKIKKVGNNTGRGDFYQYYKVPEQRYNGLRKPDIYAEYLEYDVKNLTPGETQEQKSNNRLYINVFTPLSISSKAEITSTFVDHTINEGEPGFVLQKNAEFTITPSVGTTTYNKINGTIDTSKYLKNYMIILDFDALVTQNTLDNIRSSYKSKYNVGQRIKRGTAIEIGLNDKFVAIATSDSNEGDIVSQTSNSVKVVGITKNMPSDTLLEKAKAEVATKKTTSNYTYVDKNYIRSLDYNCGDTETSTKTHSKTDYNNEIDMYYDAKYFAINSLTSRNIGRIYDFKVTDCSDIDYKKVFRNSNQTSSLVNNLTGIQYFSGIKKFNIYTNEVNTLDPRNDIDINGTVAKTILPLGPYKSTEISYVNAPKLGYRISFDLKTSGFYDYTKNSVDGAKRTVNIKPSYYYISKRGNDNGDEKIIRDIDLYYKNSSGKYVNLNGSNYTIYFKPNDGYRMEYNKADTPDLRAMSKQLEPIEIGNNSGFDLTYKMMSISDNNFIQSWYGEFKLPNSTIAVKKGSSINNPLTDGYIGVKFEITCTDELNGQKTVISYNKNDKKAELSDNTTQWDYEGFLGFTNFGHPLVESDSITLQLEKGNLTLDDDMYKFIKGTVVLFDIDNRAANDFD